MRKEMREWRWTRKRSLQLSTDLCIDDVYPSQASSYEGKQGFGSCQATGHHVASLDNDYRPVIVAGCTQSGDSGNKNRMFNRVRFHPKDLHESMNYITSMY